MILGAWFYLNISSTGKLQNLEHRKLEIHVNLEPAEKQPVQTLIHYITSRNFEIMETSNVYVVPLGTGDFEI